MLPQSVLLVECCPVEANLIKRILNNSKMLSQQCQVQRTSEVEPEPFKICKTEFKVFRFDLFS